MTYGKSMLIAGVVASMLGLNGSSAKADLFDRMDVDLDIRIGSPRPEVRRVWIEPVYETRCDRIWIEPVYENRCERVWHDAVYEMRESKVWVPDRFEVRCETYRDHRGNRVTREVRVLVERGHWDCRQERVLVCEGRWEEVPQRVCVSEGRWEQVERRVIVREGYWADQVCDTGRGGTDIRVDYERGGYYGGDRHNADYRPRRDDDRSNRRDDDRRDARRNDDDRTARDHDRAAREHYEDARDQASRRYERGDRNPRS